MDGFPPRDQDRAIINFSTVSSRIHLEGDLTVCGNGMLTFPAPRVEDSSLRHDFGVSSPPWRDEEGDLDGGDGWGAPSRSSMWIQGNFLWAGGTFDGNARVSALPSPCAAHTSAKKKKKKTLFLLHLANNTSRRKLINPSLSFCPLPTKTEYFRRYAQPRGRSCPGRTKTVQPSRRYFLRSNVRDDSSPSFCIFVGGMTD